MGATAAYAGLDAGLLVYRAVAVATFDGLAALSALSIAGNVQVPTGWPTAPAGKYGIGRCPGSGELRPVRPSPHQKAHDGNVEQVPQEAVEEGLQVGSREIEDDA